MKKILRTALTLSLVWLGSCTDYGDDFDNLNKRIDALESQIAGFADLNSGVTALDGKVNALADVLASLPNNTDFGAGLANLQEQLEALEAAMAALDANDLDIQDQVDALNDQLEGLNGDMQELLEANNVFQGDMIILNEAALDEALAYVADKETLIVDGAFVIDADYTVPSIVPEEERGEEGDFMSTPFSAAKVNQLTSKIIAILGHDWSVGLVEEDDDSIYGEYGEVPFAGEIKDVDGDLDLSNLVSLVGHIEIGDIAGNVDMSSLTRARFIESLEFNYNEDDIIDGQEYSELDDVYADELIDAGGLIFDNIEGDVDLSSLMVAWTLGFEDVSGTAKLGSLVAIMEDLLVVDGGDVDAPLLKEVGDDFELEYGGEYNFPELVWVDDEFNLVDVMGDNPTTRVNFPKLAHVGSSISIYNDFYGLDNYGGVETDVAVNTFANATYIEILGWFSMDFEWDGDDLNGLGAPLAETVILNGDLYMHADKSVISDDVVLYAPMAEVTLTFTDTYQDDYYYDYYDSEGESYLMDGSIMVYFDSLKAENLEYIDGSLYLIGPEDGLERELAVEFPELSYIYGTSKDNGGDLFTEGIASFSAPKYRQTTDMNISSSDLLSFEVGNVIDEDLSFEALESLSIKSLAPTYKSTFDLDQTNINTSTLTSVSITGLTKDAGVEDYYLDTEDEVNVCSNAIAVFIGNIESGEDLTINPTAYQALETVSLSDLAMVQIVGTTLSTLNASGNYVNFDSVNNVITTSNITWTPVECNF
jgi:hypothetical protein